jgi:hypothetical protein
VKIPALLALLLAAGRLAGQPVVVYGEDDFYVLGSGSVPGGPADPGRAAFFEAYRADVARNAPFEGAMDLVSPPAWGKTVAPDTRGRIRYRNSFPGGFACELTLEHLMPNHRYILTLNGNPARAGNNLLPKPVTPGSPEKYYDFLIVTTDGSGRYDEKLGIFLKPGDYDVRCYVKDTADFKIVLYRDFFPFQVK